MFTGIVGKGHVRALEVGEARARLVVDAPLLAGAVAIGDSVAVNGCCLTAVSVDGDGASFDLVRETLERTSLGELAVGRAVNLELALRVGDRMGGHYVTGHIDEAGRIVAITAEPGQTVLEVECSRHVADQLVPKGSVAFDGVSLTLVTVRPAAAKLGRLSVALIPHTLAATNLGEAIVGQRVNVEVDLIGKYASQAIARLFGRDDLRQ